MNAADVIALAILLGYLSVRDLAPVIAADRKARRGHELAKARQAKAGQS